MKHLKHFPPVTPPNVATPGRRAARAAYVAGTATVAVVFSPGTAVALTVMCALTVAAARSGGAA